MKIQSCVNGLRDLNIHSLLEFLHTRIELLDLIQICDNKLLHSVCACSIIIAAKLTGPWLVESW